MHSAVYLPFRVSLCIEEACGKIGSSEKLAIRVTEHVVSEHVLWIHFGKINHKLVVDITKCVVVVVTVSCIFPITQKEMRLTIWSMEQSEVYTPRG